MFSPQGVSSPDISQVNDATPIPSFLLVSAFPAEGGEEEPHVCRPRPSVSDRNHIRILFVATRDIK